MCQFTRLLTEHFDNSLQKKLLKLIRKKREEKKEKEIDLISFSLLRWTWTRKNYVMEIFVCS